MNTWSVKDVVFGWDVKDAVEGGGVDDFAGGGAQGRLVDLDWGIGGFGGAQGGLRKQFHHPRLDSIPGN